MLKRFWNNVKTRAQDAWNAVNEGIRAVTPRRAIATIAILSAVLFVIYPTQFINHAQLILRTFGIGTPTGLIVVDAPQVFTRQRLVNDRLIEDRWLLQQLNRTNELIEAGKFLRPSGEIRENSGRSLSMGDGDPPKDAEDSGETKRDNDASPVQLSPKDEFREARDYRRVVRHAKVSSQLDDSHDIDANTIYRMNFAISIVPGGPFDNFAGIQVKLSESEDPEHLKNAYGRLMAEYAAEVEMSARNLAVDRLATIGSGSYFNAEESEHVWHFVRHQTELALNALSNEFLDINSPQSQQRAEQFIQQSLRDITSAHDAQKRSIDEGRIREYLSFPQRGKRPSEDMIRAIVDQCAHNPYVDIGDSASQEHQDSPNAPPETVKQAQGRIPCARSRPQNWSLRAQFELVAALRALVSHHHRNSDFSLNSYPSNCTNCDDVSVEDIARRIPVILYPVRGRTEIPGNSAIDPATIAARESLHSEALVGAPPPIGFAVSSFVMKVMSLMWNEQSVGGLALDSSINFYLANCSASDCAIRARLKISDSANENKKQLLRFYQNLVCGSKAQTYALNPRKGANVLNATRSKDDHASVRFNEGAGAGFRANQDVMATETRRQPTFIGLGDWGIQKPNENASGFKECREHKWNDALSSQELVDGFRELRSKSRTETKFGWVILPAAQALDLAGSSSHLADSIEVTAIVSVPSWWRVADLDIRTCWMDREAVANIINTERICGDGSPNKDTKSVHIQNRHMNIKLPGSSREILQRLAFFPIKAPYLERSGFPNPVEIGRREQKVTVRGQRLWKNPRVRMGTQWADEVEVLPDMRGIIATFECVMPSPGTSGSLGPVQQNQYEQPEQTRILEVWTSEGVTAPEQVTVYPFTPRAGTGAERPDQPCWNAPETSAKIDTSASASQ